MLDDFDDIQSHFSDAHVFTPFNNKAHFAKSMANKKSVFDYTAKDYKELQSQFLHMTEHIESQLN